LARFIGLVNSQGRASIDDEYCEVFVWFRCVRVRAGARRTHFKNPTNEELFSREIDTQYRNCTIFFVLAEHLRITFSEDSYDRFHSGTYRSALGYESESRKERKIRNREHRQH
jgi:hypothetical protein